MSGTATEFQARQFRSVTGLNLDIAKVTRGGPYHNALAETLAQIEYDNPGTFESLTSWSAFGRSAQKQATLDRVQAELDITFEAIDRGLLASHKGALIGQGLATERVSPVHPALSAKNGRRELAKAGLGLPGVWEGHHIAPFAEVKKLDIDVQLGLVASGWRMDSLENLVALPADEATYLGPANRGNFPIHNRSHSKYSAMVGRELQALELDRANGFASIRGHMNQIGSSALSAIFGGKGRENGFHSVLK